jgi:hypothetical protein
VPISVVHANALLFVAVIAYERGRVPISIPLCNYGSGHMLGPSFFNLGYKFRAMIIIKGR